MTIRSFTLSLTAVAVVTVFGVGCAQSTSPSSSSTAYTPTAANMGNAAVSPDNSTSMTGRSAATMDGSLNSDTSAGTSVGTGMGSSTGMTTTDSNTGTRGLSSMNRSDNDSVMRAARADRN